VVEFAFASPEWAATEPCDAGTLAVVKSGIRVVYAPFTYAPGALRPSYPGDEFMQAWPRIALKTGTPLFRPPNSARMARARRFSRNGDRIP
jgi:hypothetical protein